MGHREDAVTSSYPSAHGVLEAQNLHDEIEDDLRRYLSPEELAEIGGIRDLDQDDPTKDRRKRLRQEDSHGQEGGTAFSVENPLAGVLAGYESSE